MRSMFSVWQTAMSQRKKRLVILLLVVVMALTVSGSVHIDTEQLKGMLILITFFTVCLALFHANERSKELRLMKASSGYQQRKQLESILTEILMQKDSYVVRDPFNASELHVSKETGLFGVVTYYVWFEYETLSHVDDNTMRNVYRCTTEMYCISTDLAKIDLHVEVSWKVDETKARNSEDSWQYEKDAGELLSVFAKVRQALHHWTPSSVA